MAAGEKFSGSSSKPESKDSGSGENSSKRTAPVRVPLGLSSETPVPKPETQTSKRLFDIIAEQQLQEQLRRHVPQGEDMGSDKKKSKKNKKKRAAEQAEPTEYPAEVPEPSESLSTVIEPSEEEEDKLVSEGAVEIALDDTTEKEVELSDRVKEWNRSRPKSPPTAPMSEVGQPTVLPEEVLAPEVESVSIPIEARLVEASSATAEIEPTSIPEAVTPEADEEEHAPIVAPPVFDWQPQPQIQHRAEAQPASSVPEAEPPFVVEPIETEASTSQSELPMDDDVRAPLHNPLFTQQGIDPALMHQRAGETPAVPAVAERVVHHRPSDFWPGVLVGGAVEHIRHKRRERKMEKSQKLQQSRIAQLEYTQRRTALEQQTEADERLRAENAARYEKPATAPDEYPMPFVAERNPAQLKPEQQPKQPLPEQPVAAEEVKPLEGHHIEKSTWHKIEVDDRTGRVAENTNIVYGEAFQREQRPEQLAAMQAQQEEDEREREIEALSAAGAPTLPKPQVGMPDAVPGVIPKQPQQPTTDVAPRRSSRPALIQSGADLALWGGLVLVVLAIIAALAL